MPLTLHDITPIGLCIATQDLFDARRFQSNFCDNLILRSKDKELGPKLTSLKRELNSTAMEREFLNGHKTAIISNIDKILGLVSSRYMKIDFRVAENVFSSGKELIKKVLVCETFRDIGRLESEFKSKITLPVYELFIGYMKKANISII